MKTILVLIMVLAAFSCQKAESKFDKKYYGAVVKGKTINGLPEYFLVLRKMDSTYVTVKVQAPLYYAFTEGDTIK